MIITHKLSVDMTTRGEIPRVDAVQGDVNTRVVELALTERDVPFSIPGETAAVVRFRKEDGTGGVYNTLPDGSDAYSISGDTVRVFLVPQVLSCPGFVTVSVALTKNGSVLGVFAFRILVEPDPSVGTVESENYFSFDSLEAINTALAGFESSIDSLQQQLGDIRTGLSGQEAMLSNKMEKKKLSREYENRDYILALTYHTTGSDVQSGKSKILMYLSSDGVNFSKVGMLPAEVGANIYDISTTYHDGKWIIAYDWIDRSYNDWTEEHNLYNRGGNRVGILTTTDFVNFTNRYLDLPAEWKSTWAPEVFSDNGNLYIALTTSTCTKTYTKITGDTRYVKDGIYICELNDDFSLANYTQITLPDDGITPENYIDASVYKKDGTYYLAIKEETYIIQRLYKSTSLFGGYTLVHEFDEMGEGMAFVKFNGKYLAYSDKFVDAGMIQKRGTYLAVSGDMETWSSMVLVNNQGDAYNRHFTPCVVTTEEQKATISNFIKRMGSVDTPVEGCTNKSYLLAQNTEVNVIERLLLQPNAVYYVINAGQVTINSVDTSLMKHGDTCKFLVASRNSAAAITFRYSEENTLYWGNSEDLEFKRPDGTITVCCTHGSATKYCFADAGEIHRENTLNFPDGVSLLLQKNGNVVTAMLRGTVDSLTAFQDRMHARVLPDWAVPPRTLTFYGKVLHAASHLGCIMELTTDGTVKYNADKDITSAWIAVNATYQTK